MSTPTDVEVQLSPEGDPLGIIWQRPDYRAAELTSLTTKLLERVADDVATRVREEMRRVLADSATFGHHPRDTAKALQEAYGEVLSSTLSRMLTISQLGGTLACSVGVQLLGACDGEHSRECGLEDFAVRLLESARGVAWVVTEGGGVRKHTTHFVTDSRSDVVSDALEELGGEAG